MAAELRKSVRQYLARIGRKGGQSTSAAKVAAVRANGRKGGHPGKVKAQPDIHAANPSSGSERATAEAVAAPEIVATKAD